MKPCAKIFQKRHFQLISQGTTADTLCTDFVEVFPVKYNNNNVETPWQNTACA